MVELVADGEVVARGAGQVTAAVPAASWVAARLGGHRVGHTAPIPLRAEFSRRQAAAAYLRPLIERTREWIVSHGRFSQPQRRQALLDRVAAALARLEQPPPSAAPTPAG